MLYNKLKNYSKSGIYPFHMPGHKRQDIDPDRLLPYKIDLTEINGFDNLHNAQGIIADIQKKAEKLYNVNKAFMLVNGATGGILSAIRAMTSYGDKILVARNCHKSVYNAIELCGLEPVYILPEYDKGFGIFGSIEPNKVKAVLEENPDIKLVIITSPTYEGVVSDIKTISAICKDFNTKLFVDEAHGAHFPFSNSFPSEAVSCGADVAVVSLHKTLPAFTQTALLLTNRLDIVDALSENLSIFESSSPSYVLMSSIELCLEYVNNNSFEEYIKQLEDFSKSLMTLDKIKVLCYGTDRKCNHSFFDFDISKLIISTKNTNLSGNDLADILRKDYNIEIEMAYTDYIIAMTSICDSNIGFEMLKNALIEIDKNCKLSDRHSNTYISELPSIIFKSSLINSHKGCFIDVDLSVGRTSLEYVWAYPPGIPLLVPGEKISKNLLNLIKTLTKNGVEVYSTKQNMPDKIYVTLL